MKMLECTAGAVGVTTMRVTTSVAQAVGIHLLLPTVRTHSKAGVGLYEVRGSDKGWGAHETGAKNATTGIDPTAFPTRLGPPPDDPPVN